MFWPAGRSCRPFFIKEGKLFELGDLEGMHWLSGVDMGIENDCCYFEFQLDGVTYRAVEDPDDGFRSMCSELVRTSHEPRFNGFIQRVRCTTVDSDAILEIRSADTGVILLEVGTDYSGDEYYPCFHHYWNPKALSANIFVEEDHELDNEISPDDLNSVL